jgi:CRISPR-associated protein Csm2
MKITLWKDKEKGIIDPKLFSEKANELAIRLSSDIRKDKRTQLRKFYDEIIRLNMLAKSNPESWDNVLPFVHMVTAKAAYAKGRELISDDFLEFVKTGIDQVDSPKDLNVFASFFEAFLGFYKMHNPRD